MFPDALSSKSMLEPEPSIVEQTGRHDNIKAIKTGSCYGVTAQFHKVIGVILAHKMVTDSDEVERVIKTINERSISMINNFLGSYLSCCVKNRKAMLDYEIKFNELLVLVKFYQVGTTKVGEETAQSFWNRCDLEKTEAVRYSWRFPLKSSEACSAGRMVSGLSSGDGSMVGNTEKTRKRPASDSFDTVNNPGPVAKNEPFSINENRAEHGEDPSRGNTFGITKYYQSIITGILAHLLKIVESDNVEKTLENIGERNQEILIEMLERYLSCCCEYKKVMFGVEINLEELRLLSQFDKPSADTVDSFWRSFHF